MKVWEWQNDTLPVKKWAEWLTHNELSINPLLYCCCRRRQWHPPSVLLPGESHGRGSLVGYSPWGREESDTTEQLHFHISLSCIGEGNGTPLQYSCLENPKDRRACRAAVYGVAQSWTRLTRLSNSSILLLQLLLCSWHEACAWRLFIQWVRNLSLR